MLSRIVMLVLGLVMVLVGGQVAIAAGGGWSSMYQLPAKGAGVTLEQPLTLAVDGQSERYYVVDAGSGQLVSFDSSGAFLAAFNAGGQLKRPVAMAKTSSGSLWVVERSTNELLYINPKEKKVQRFSPRHAGGDAVFMSRIAVDGKNRLYVLDSRRGQVLRLDDNLAVEQRYAAETARGMFVDFSIRNGKLWALSALTREVASFDLAGRAEKLIKINGLQFPVALDVDPAGQLYLLDRHAGAVVVYSLSGQKKFDLFGKGKRAGQLWNASDLLFDWAGRLCVVDEGSGRVEVLSR